MRLKLLINNTAIWNTQPKQHCHLKHTSKPSQNSWKLVQFKTIVDTTHARRFYLVISATIPVMNSAYCCVPLGSEIYDFPSWNFRSSKVGICNYKWETGRKFCTLSFRDTATWLLFMWTWRALLDFLLVAS